MLKECPEDITEFSEGLCWSCKDMGVCMVHSLCVDFASNSLNCLSQSDLALDKSK